MALRERLLAALPRLPGACGVYLFGSLACGGGDCYSDIDVQVLTTDLPASVAALPAILRRVGSVDVAWQLDSPVGDWCATIVWRDESPYHRTDIGLTAVAAPDALPAGIMPGAIRIWEGQCLGAAGEGDTVGLPLLTPGTPGHFLAGHLISGLRYAKARRRGQSLACWRYAAAIADWTATLLLDRSGGWRGSGAKIGGSEYHRLDGVVDGADRARFERCLSFATPVDMDASVSSLLRWLAELATEKAAATQWWVATNRDVAAERPEGSSGAVVTEVQGAIAVPAAAERVMPAAVIRLLAAVEVELAGGPPATGLAPAGDSHCGARSLAARAASWGREGAETAGCGWQPVVTLEPMDAGQYRAWRAGAVANYAGEKVRAGNWPAADAADLAERDFARLLPQGVETPGHSLMSVLNGDGVPVGYVWFGPGPADQTYLYDIAIDPRYRRRGYGRAAMLALEERVLSSGLRGIALHVFGHNTAARGLYEALGYTVTNVNMAKSLVD